MYKWIAYGSCVKPIDKSRCCIDGTLTCTLGGCAWSWIHTQRCPYMYTWQFVFGAKIKSPWFPQNPLARWRNAKVIKTRILVLEYGSDMEEEWIAWKAINKKTIDVVKNKMVLSDEDDSIWLSVKIVLLQVWIVGEWSYTVGLIDRHRRQRLKFDSSLKMVELVELINDNDQFGGLNLMVNYR